MKTKHAKFNQWFKRQEAMGLALTDAYSVGVVRAVAEMAYNAGRKHLSDEIKKRTYHSTVNYPMK